MTKYFLALFGVIGLAISVVEGIEPFIEVTRWIAWISENWTVFWRSLWANIFARLGVQISTELADGLTGCAYILSLMVATRRLKNDREDLLRPIDSLIERIGRVGNAIEFTIPENFGVTLLLLFIFSPLATLTFLVSLHSAWQAIPLGLVGLALFLMFMIDTGFIADMLDTLAEQLFGKPKDLWTSPASDNFVLTVLTIPLGILAAVVVILCINEIAANGSNFLDAYDWARCDAGIECKQ